MDRTVRHSLAPCPPECSRPGVVRFAERGQHSKRRRQDEGPDLEDIDRDLPQHDQRRVDGDVSDEEVGADLAAVPARWFDVADLPKLAFDHAELLRRALEYLRRRIADALRRPTLFVEKATPAKQEAFEL